MKKACRDTQIMYIDKEFGPHQSCPSGGQAATPAVQMPPAATGTGEAARAAAKQVQCLTYCTKVQHERLDERVVLDGAAPQQRKV
jgi:hypothetical protein